MKPRMKVGFVSLGCSKNLIDTEMAIGMFQEHMYTIENRPKEADIIVINTCGFIDSAKEEAIHTILEMAEYKKQKCKYLIVMGCLVQRYYDELIKCLPEVDLFIKLEEYNTLWQKVEDLIKRDIVIKAKETTNKIPMLEQKDFMNRVVTTGKDYAYLKIGEGCSNRCTYCAIPQIRGPFVSRKKEDILEEANMLAKKGITELIVIAQDTTKYGVDLYGESKLAELLEALSHIKGIHWIRFLYAYPEGITQELIELVANNDKIANYFDIPIQHINNRILKRMNRKTTKEQIQKLLESIRNQIPDVVLRTSLIVGFPGETPAEFEELKNFVKEAKFDKLGVFQYSKEEGTPAAKLPEQIHGNTKKARYRQIMTLQQTISKQNLEKRIGKEYEVLVENCSFDGTYSVGRTMQDAPEIDGLVYIKNTGKAHFLHKFVRCVVEEVSNYDIIARVKENEILF